jgi:hypothetical protein
MDGWMDGQTDRQIDGWMHACMDEWMYIYNIYIYIIYVYFIYIYIIDRQKERKKVGRQVCT